jgi:hypothetical protein
MTALDTVECDLLALVARRAPLDDPAWAALLAERGALLAKTRCLMRMEQSRAIGEQIRRAVERMRSRDSGELGAAVQAGAVHRHYFSQANL